MTGQKDRGDTLLEILIAIVLLSLGVVATMTGLMTSIHTTRLNSAQAQITATLTSAAEWVKANGWVTCTSTTPTILTDLIGQAAINAYFSVTVNPPAPFDGGTCKGDGTTTNQLEEQQINVTGPSGALGTLTVVTRWS